MRPDGISVQQQKNKAHGVRDTCALITVSHSMTFTVTDSTQSQARSPPRRTCCSSTILNREHLPLPPPWLLCLAAPPIRSRPLAPLPSSPLLHASPSHPRPPSPSPDAPRPPPSPAPRPTALAPPSAPGHAFLSAPPAPPSRRPESAEGFRPASGCARFCARVP